MEQQNALDFFIHRVIYEQFDRVVRNSKYNVQRMDKMYAHPAQFEVAQLHKRANGFGYVPKSSKQKQDTLCSCCELPLPRNIIFIIIYLFSLFQSFILIDIESINLCYPTTPNQDFTKPNRSEPYQLNAGSSMFFTFIKMAIIYLALRFAITDGYNLITNILAKNCQDPKNFQDCRSNIAAKFSNYNKNTDTDQTHVFIVDILNIATVIASMIFFTIYRKYQLSIFRFAGISNHSQADYTIFVEQIPILFMNQQVNNDVSLADCRYKSRLKQLFQKQVNILLDGIETKKKQFFKSNIKLNQLQTAIEQVKKQNPTQVNKQNPIVKSITLCYDLTQLQKLNNLRSELMKRHNDKKVNTKNNQKSSEQTSKKDKQLEQLMKQKRSQKYFLNQIKALNNQIIRLTKKFSQENSPQFNTSHFLGKAFISFQYQHYKQYFLEYLKQDIRFNDLDKKLKITTAAQPSDVYWYNMTVPQRQRYWSIFYSSVAMALSLVVSCALLLVLQYLKMKISNKSSSMQAQAKTTTQIIIGYGLTAVMTVATTIINYGLEKYIERLTKLQRHMTKTDQIISLIVKTVIAQFLNTAIIYYIISLIADIFLLNDIKSSLGDNGLIMNITSLIAVSGLIQIFTNFVQLGELFSCIYNYFNYSKEKTENLFQVELNKELQPSEFSFAVRYSYYILNVFVVSFYSYIVPYTSLMLIVIFAFQYWGDKFNLFKRFSCPTAFNYRLSIFTLKIFQCSIFFFALGNLLFAPTIHTNIHGSNYRIINIISLFLAFFYCLAVFFLPIQWLQNFTSIEFQNLSYSKCMKQHPFNKVYQLQNPATTFAKEPAQKKQKGQIGNISYVRQSKFAEASDLQLMKVMKETRDKDKNKEKDEP